MSQPEPSAVSAAQPARRFRVITRCNSRVRTPAGRVFEFIDKGQQSRLVGGTLYGTDPFGTRVPSWLQMEVDCPAKDATGAERLAYQAVHQLACLFALAGNAPVGLPLVYLIYEVRGDQAERGWEQRFHVENVGLASRLVEPGAVVALVEGINGMDPEDAAKVATALRWYRSALGTDDLLERFSMVWAGLETLNVLLQIRLSLVRNELSACPHCGEPIPRPSASGVHTWIETSQGVEVRRKARKLRTALAHGLGTIGQAVALVDEVGGPVERALVEAILELIGTKLNPPRVPLAPEVMFLARITGTLVGPVEEHISSSESHPHVSGELHVKASRNTGPDGGGVELEYELPGEKVVPNGVTLTVTQVEVPQEDVG